MPSFINYSNAIHSSRHGAGGPDEITPADIGADVAGAAAAAQAAAAVAATAAIAAERVTERALQNSTYGRHPASHSVVTLGDSRMNRDGSVSGVPFGVETAVYATDRGIVSWANTILRKRLRFLQNGGVGGDTVAQMLARTDALLAYNPGWLIGFGHINSASANATAAAIIADLTAIFDKVDTAGVRLVWGTDWQVSTSTAPQRAVSYAVNDWLRKQAGIRRNLILVDYQAVFVDPTTGNPVAAYTTDGVHQETPGAFVLGQQLANALSIYIDKSDRLIASNDDTTNLLPNGMLTGNSSGTSSGWGSEGATLVGTPSKVARTDGYPGEWQQVAVAGAAGWYYFRNSVTIGATVAVGDSVYGECEFETDAAGWTAQKFFMQVQMVGSFAGGTVVQSNDMMHVSGALATPTRPASGIFRTPPVVVPVGTTSIKIGVQMEVGAGTFRLAKIRLAKPA